jgi:hypothetical protein
MKSNSAGNSPVRPVGTIERGVKAMPGMFEIELRFQPVSNNLSPFEDLLDAVTDELAKIGVDADYTATVADLTATWTIDVPDASEESLIGALTALQTALENVGCVTPDPLPSKHEVVSTRHLALA